MIIYISMGVFAHVAKVYGLFMCQVVEAQDLELLEDLHPWIERSRLDQRPDAASLLWLSER